MILNAHCKNFMFTIDNQAKLGWFGYYRLKPYKTNTPLYYLIYIYL